jgi:hypothetical protein
MWIETVKMGIKTHLHRCENLPESSIPKFEISYLYTQFVADKEQ